MSFWENFHLSSNLLRGGSRTAATSKMECFVMPLTIITRHSILNVAAVLDPPLLLCTEDMWARHFYFFVQQNTWKKLKSIANNRTLPLHLKLKKPVSPQFTESLHLVIFDQLWKSYLHFLQISLVDTLHYTEFILCSSIEKFNREINSLYSQFSKQRQTE